MIANKALRNERAYTILSLIPAGVLSTNTHALANKSQSGDATGPYGVQTNKPEECPGVQDLPAVVYSLAGQRSSTRISVIMHQIVDIVVSRNILELRTIKPFGTPCACGHAVRSTFTADWESGASLFLRHGPIPTEMSTAASRVDIRFLPAWFCVRASPGLSTGKSGLGLNSSERMPVSVPPA
jgi:hypothetical protein